MRPSIYMFQRELASEYFFQSSQASVARTCARVCAVNVNHEEGLLQPSETIATVNAGVDAVKKMVNQGVLCIKCLRVRCVGETIFIAVSLVRVSWQMLNFVPIGINLRNFGSSVVL